MLTWIIHNIGTIVAGLILAVILCAAVATILRNNRKGKSSCGCGCTHCAMAGSCRKTK